MNYENSMDEIISAALKGNEQPSADFTEKVMERCAKLPQKRTVSHKKMVVSVAACAAVLVVAFPILRLTTMRTGSSADCAEAEYMMDNAAVAEEPAAETSPAEGSEDFFVATNDSCAAEEEAECEAECIESEAQKSAAPAVVIEDAALCADVRLWLEGNGFPAAENEQQIEFTLTDAQLAALKQAFPEVTLPDGADTIRLEG